MRHIILVLIALVALAGLLPGVMSLPPAPFVPETENSFATTPSMAAFLNDSWTPSAFVAPLANNAPVFTKGAFSNNTTNATYAAYDFLNNTSVPSSGTYPIYTAAAPAEDNKIAWTGESIYQFLADNWTPSTPVAVYDQGVYKLHQMN